MAIPTEGRAALKAILLIIDISLNSLNRLLTTIEQTLALVNLLLYQSLSLSLSKTFSEPELLTFVLGTRLVRSKLKC